jgi:murein DD-endopeptidase MepM/ murein hydrolase activator NlpD
VSCRVGLLSVVVGLSAIAACSGGDLVDRQTATTDVVATIVTPNTAAVAPTTTSSAVTTTTEAAIAMAPATTVPVPTATIAAAPPTARTSTPYAVPVGDVDAAGWGTTHSGYPASDIFSACGAVVVAPVNGTALEVRTQDDWDAAVDNPATRGGRSVSLIGDDGVRYYMAHFETIDPALVPGGAVSVNQVIGTIGRTGRASACHLHFAISPPCPGQEWSVRRGVIWPYPYLDAWKVGEQLSPLAETTAWTAANPDACAIAMSDPDAGDA